MMHSGGEGLIVIEGHIDCGAAKLAHKHYPSIPRELTDSLSSFIEAISAIEKDVESALNDPIIKQINRDIENELFRDYLERFNEELFAHEKFKELIKASKDKQIASLDLHVATIIKAVRISVSKLVKSKDKIIADRLSRGELGILGLFNDFFHSKIYVISSYPEEIGSKFTKAYRYQTY